jgi:hypothetical protein
MKPKQRISESFFMKLAKLLIAPKYRPQLDKYESELKNNGEFQSLVHTLDKTQEDLNIMVKDFCKRYPTSSLCKKGK